MDLFRGCPQRSVRSATTGVSSRTRNPYFVILGASLLFDNSFSDACSALGIWHIWISAQFHSFSPIFTLFHTFFAHFCRMLSVLSLFLPTMGTLVLLVLELVNLWGILLLWFPMLGMAPQLVYVHLPMLIGVPWYQDILFPILL